MAEILGTGTYSSGTPGGYWAAGENPWDPARWVDTSTTKYNITKLPGLDFGTISPYSSFSAGQLDPNLVNYMNQNYGYNLYDYMARMGASGQTPLLGSSTTVPVGGTAPQTAYQLYAGQVDPFMQAIGASNDPMAQQYFSALGGGLTQAEALERQRQEAQEKAATREWATLAALGIGAPLGLAAAGVIPMGATGAGLAAAGAETAGALGAAGFDASTIGGAMGNLGYGGSSAGLGLSDAAWGVNPQGSGMFDLGGWENYGFYGDPLADYSWTEGLGSAFGDLGTTYPEYINFGEAYNPVNAFLGDLGLSGMPSVPGGSSILGSLFGGGGQQQGGGLGGLLGGLFGGGNNALLGALLGGALGGLGGDRQSGTIDVTQTPWGPQQPYLTQGFQSAANTLGQAQPSQVTGPAEQQLLSTIQGDYLNPETNPYLKQTFDIAAANVTPQVESYFAKYGRQGSNAAGNVLGNQLTNLANQIYGGNYQQERARQAQGILGAPQFAQQGYNALFAPTTNYMNAIRGNYGQTQSTPYFTNPYANILGGALTGAQLGGLF